MVWTVEVTPRARRALGKLDRQTSARIVARLEDISRLEDPHSRGKALTGQLTGLWRYHVDDWRVIGTIEGQRLVIIVLTVGNRREVYRGNLRSQLVSSVLRTFAASAFASASPN